MGRITARTRSPDRASRVREADNRRSESGAAAAVGDWDRDFATHAADLAGGRQSIVCVFSFPFYIILGSVPVRCYGTTKSFVLKTHGSH